MLLLSEEGRLKEEKRGRSWGKKLEGPLSSFCYVPRKVGKVTIYLLWRKRKGRGKKKDGIEKIFCFRISFLAAEGKGGIFRPNSERKYNKEGSRSFLS